MMDGFHLGACLLNDDDEPANIGCVTDCPRRLHAEIERLRSHIYTHKERFTQVYHSKKNDPPPPTTGIHADLWAVLGT